MRMWITGVLMALVAEQEFELWDENTKSAKYSWLEAAHSLCTELDQQSPTPNPAHRYEPPNQQVNKPPRTVTSQTPGYSIELT